MPGFRAAGVLITAQNILYGSYWNILLWFTFREFRQKLFHDRMRNVPFSQPLPESGDGLFHLCHGPAVTDPVRVAEMPLEPKRSGIA